MQDLEQSIRERAYHLWMESGCPDGNAEAHWLAAQREVLSASVNTFARVPEVKQPASLQPAASGVGAVVATTVDGGAGPDTD